MTLLLFSRHTQVGTHKSAHTSRHTHISVFLIFGESPHDADIPGAFEYSGY